MMRVNKRHGRKQRFTNPSVCPTFSTNVSRRGAAWCAHACAGARNAAQQCGAAAARAEIGVGVFIPPRANAETRCSPVDAPAAREVERHRAKIRTPYAAARQVSETAYAVEKRTNPRREQD